ncbi:disulfide bond formation protein B [Streptomyces sp. cg36]|uniref:disulfide bond formation protein B n=1 Tax=Streptomyces sp. cg36 TaxID=3238798 RepID=UPI0034E1C374
MSVVTRTIQRDIRFVGYWGAHLFVLAYSLVLLSAFLLQFAGSELPCVLCMLQRMAMIFTCMGPIYIISRSMHHEMSVTNFARGYGFTLVGAVIGLLMSLRQITNRGAALDPGYGTTVLGLHAYTWAFVSFAVVVLWAGVNMLFAVELTPPARVPIGRASKLVLGFFFLMVVANIVSVFFEVGFHWALPHIPLRYQLLYDLGLK